MKSFLLCGYSKEQLEKAKTQALSINRNGILKNSEQVIIKRKDPIVFILTFSVTAFSVHEFLDDLLGDIDFLTGPNENHNLL